MNWLLEPLQYQFIQNALISSVLIGMVCAMLGVYVVLRRMSFIGHALSHSALPGLVIAYMLHLNILGGVLVIVILTAWGIGLISKDDIVYEDTAIGMIPTVMFAIGILLISTTKSYRDMSSMLFGNILGVSIQDLKIIVSLVLIVLICLKLFHKELILFSVDSHYAKSIGIKLSFLRFGLLTLLALTVVVGVQAVGTILTNALLIAPVAASRMVTNKLRTMIILACLIAVSSGVIGVYLSYYFGLASGATIVLMCAVWFFVIFGIKKFNHKKAM